MAEPRSPRWLVVALVVLWTAVMGSISLACYGHNCDGDVQVYGRNQGEGRLLSADLWESSPIDGMWLEFPKQRAWVFEIGDIGDREPQVITPYVSAQADPNHEPGGNFTVAGGNLAEISGVSKGRMVVKNGTCADYFLRVTVQTAPFPPAPTPASPAPTGTSTTADAGGDAGAIP